MAHMIDHHLSALAGCHQLSHFIFPNELLSIEELDDRTAIQNAQRCLRRAETKHLQLLIEATSKGISLVAQDLRNNNQQLPPPRSVGTVCRLCICLSRSLEECESMFSDQHHDHTNIRQWISDTLRTTGLLSNLQQLCTALASFVPTAAAAAVATQQRDLDAQSIAQLHNIATQALILCLLDLFLSAARPWPNAGILQHKSPLATAAAELLISALRCGYGVTGLCSSPVSSTVSSNRTAIVLFLASSCGGPRSVTSQHIMVWTTPHAAVACSLLLLDSIKSAANNTTGEEPHAGAAGISSCVKKLLLLYIGLMVKAQHSGALKATAPAAVGSRPKQQRKQQQQQHLSVPAYHEQLLRVLRVPDAVRLHDVEFITTTMPASQAATAMLFSDALMCLDDEPESSSSSSRCDGPGWSGSGHLHIRDVVLPLLLTLVEGVALEDPLDLTHLSVAVAVMMMLIQIHHHWLCQQLDHQRQVATIVLPAVVQMVLPAVLAAEAVGERPQATPQLQPGVPVKAGEVLQQLSALIAVLLKSLMSSPGDPVITDTVTAAAFYKLFQQHPEQMIRLLEIFVRGNCTKDQCSTLLTTMDLVAQLMWAAGQPTCRTSAKLMLFGAANDLATPIAPAVAAAAASHSWMQNSQQLFSLVCTVLKTEQILLQTYPEEDQLEPIAQTLTILGDIIMMLTRLLARCSGSKQLSGPGLPRNSSTGRAECSTGSSSSRSRSTSSSSSSRSSPRDSTSCDWSKLWSFLLARCLLISGRLVGKLPAGKPLTSGLESACQVAVMYSLFAWSSSLQRLASVLPCFADTPGQQSVPTAIPAAELREMLADETQLRAGIEGVWSDLPSELLARAVNFELRESGNHSIEAQLKCFNDAADARVAQVAAAGALTLIHRVLVPEPILRLAEQLETFGAALCTLLPVQLCCNSHTCSNADKLSELELVNGKSCVCLSCKTARYCRRACQKAHWNDWHKPVCKRIKEAAAAAAGEPI